MPLINTKLHLELNWTKNSVMSNAANATTFQITKAQLYVPVVTLNTNDNLKLKKLLSKGFQRSVFWNEYKSKIQTESERDANENVTLRRILLDASFQGVSKLYVAAYGNTAGVNRIDMNCHKKYALPRINLAKFNVLIDGRNFYDQPIGDEIRKYDELRKVTTGKGDDYTTGCLLDYKYFKDHYSIITCDLSN